MGLSREEAERRAPAYFDQGWSEQDVAAKIVAAMKGSPSAVRSVFAENGPWMLHKLLPSLACPTLLLFAASDRGGVVDAEALSLARANLHVRTVLVPDADHNIHRTRFASFMAATEPFLVADGA